MILNGLPWKQTEIILSFLRLHPSTAFWTLVIIGHLDSSVNIGHYKVLSRVLCAIHSLWFSCAFPSWLVMFNIFHTSIWPFILIGELSRWSSLVTYNWVVFFCWWSVRVLYIFWILNIFSHSVGFSTFLIMSSNTQKLFILVKSKLSILGLVACTLGILSKNPLPNVCGLCFYGPHL